MNCPYKENKIKNLFLEVKVMLGSIVGDIVGSIYEFNNHRSKKFPLFGDGCDYTDDTVLTVAVADCFMRNGNYAEYIKNYARK